MSVSGENYRIACLRLPALPLQWLYRQQPDWRGRKVAWLEQLKPDSPLRYLSPQAEALGLTVGMRYASALGLVPDLLAGSCDLGALSQAEKAILKLVRRFTPGIRRGSGHLANGLYSLDARGLSMAFGGMRNWARQLVTSLRRHGWEAVLAVGYTPFACEMATYQLSVQQPLHLFTDRQQEQQQTLRLPLTLFGLSPDQVRRLHRLGVRVLEDLLVFEIDEVRRRFGPDLMEFYEKASQAILAESSPLPEEEPLWAGLGFPDPIADQATVVRAFRRLLERLLPALIRQEKAVSQLWLALFTEEGQRLVQRLAPSYPTVDSAWLGQLLSLRLERTFQRHPLRWGSRIERVRLTLLGEPDPEKQGELFSSWDEPGEQARPPRDREAALWALSRVRAEYGEGCLCQAELVDHALPGRDYVWKAARESKAWFGLSGGSGAEPDLDPRVRRQLSTPHPLSGQDRWPDKEGPYLLSGSWWESRPYARRYFFARQGQHTGWIYWDELQQGWYAEGWLQ
jgi:protein ImuB